VAVKLLGKYSAATRKLRDLGLAHALPAALHEHLAHRLVLGVVPAQPHLGRLGQVIAREPVTVLSGDPGETLRVYLLRKALTSRRFPY